MLRGFVVRACIAVLGSLVLILGGGPGVAAQSLDRVELEQWKTKDSSSTCDEIGWDAGKIIQGSPDEDDLLHHLSCVGSVGYLAVCGTISGDGMFFTPSMGDNWIACYIIAANMGSGEASVSLFDFSLVGANGRKYSQDFSAQASLDISRMFPTETIREGQNVDGIIAFAVPKSTKLPYILEIDQMLNFSLRKSSPGAIVITELRPLSSVVGR